jgi:tetratricopeptide (TPR) repeat protein
MALQRDAQQVQARYCRGLSLAAQQQWASAHADFDQVIAAQPTWAEAYLNRGYVARAMGDRENAQHDWTHFLHLPEGDVALQAQVRIWLAELESEVTAATHTVGERLQLARQAYLAGDGATALRHYDAVVETDPPPTERGYWRGRICTRCWPSPKRHSATSPGCGRPTPPMGSYGTIRR